MANLIKMDLRRLFHSKLFIVLLSVTVGINIVFSILIGIIMKLLPIKSGSPFTEVSSLISDVFSFPFALIIVFVAVTGFFYSDISGGFIKNIAGQVPRRSDLIISKFVSGSIMSLSFFCLGTVSNLIGGFIVSVFGLISLSYETSIAAGLLTLLLKWFISIGIISVLLFVTNALRSKVLAIVLAVLIGTGSLGLAYMGVNSAVANLFHIPDFDLGMYMPDTLISRVNVVENTAVLNSVIVSIVFIAVFLALTIYVFNKRDIK